MMGARACGWAVTDADVSRNSSIRLELIGEKKEYEMTGVSYFPKEKV